MVRLLCFLSVRPELVEGLFKAIAESFDKLRVSGVEVNLALARF